MPLALILLAVTSGSFYYIVQAEGVWGELPRLMERVGIKTDKIPNPKSEIPTNSAGRRNKPEIPNNKNAEETTIPDQYFSGNSRFSRGTCANDRDCFVGGCSGEVCSSEPDVISTCEYSEDFPSTEKFECGCVNMVCGWRNK